jgi:hypothetical protein
MRDLFKKVMTGSMVAGAALFVAACGGGDDATTNNTSNFATDDALMGNDVTTIDATNGADANLGTAVDANMGTTTTTGGNTTTTTTTTDTGNSAGTGNTTGM